MPSRGVCQHTSCRACFLLIEPPSSCEAITCSEPPQKQCLQPYYQCIRNHVMGVSSNSLDAPATILVSACACGSSECACGGFLVHTGRPRCLDREGIVSLSSFTWPSHIQKWNLNSN